MEKYETMSHRADLMIKAFGKTKKDLFLNMLIGMVKNQHPTIKTPEVKIKRNIRIRSGGLGELLIDFLNEVLYLSQTHKETYYGLYFKEFTPHLLEGELVGKKIERLGSEIKAATHHGLDISFKKGSGWKAVVLFDV